MAFFKYDLLIERKKGSSERIDMSGFFYAESETIAKKIAMTVESHIISVLSKDRDFIFNIWRFDRNRHELGVKLTEIDYNDSSAFQKSEMIESILNHFFKENGI